MTSLIGTWWKPLNTFKRKNGMSADGLCGPGTFRVIYNERMADLEEYRPANSTAGEKFIISNGDYFPIEWPKVKLFFEGDGMKLTKGLRKHVGERKPVFFCLSLGRMLVFEDVSQGSSEPRDFGSLRH